MLQMMKKAMLTTMATLTESNNNTSFLDTSGYVKGKFFSHRRMNRTLPTAR